MNLLTTARRLDALAIRIAVPGLQAAAAICGLTLLTDAELEELARYGDATAHGEMFYELRGERGELRELAFMRNLITDVGDAFYAKRAWQISTVPDIGGGMKLGTGTANSAKVTNTGTPVYARIQTYVTGSAAAFSGGYPQGAAGTGYQATVKSSWAAGTATATGIAEATVSNQNGSGNTPATPSNSADANDTNTLARAQLSPIVNKGALDTLDVTWYHVLLGA